eukprot:RCo051080
MQGPAGWLFSSSNSGVPRPWGELEGQPPDVLLSPLNWVDEQLSLLSSRYTTPTEVTVAVCSYNVDQGKPPANLAEWLHVKSRPEVIAVGLQEVDMSMMALKSEETEKHRPWLLQLSAELEASADPMRPCKYVELKHRQLVGLFLVVFVRRDIYDGVSDVDLQTECTGAMSGTLGNKGGIGLSFRLFNSRICLINAHLAAHMEHADKRLKNFQQIVSTMRFRNKTLAPREHDLLVFFGDMNYRIGPPVVISHEEVMDAVRREDWRTLLRHDQLLQQIREGGVFEGFTAAAPLFPPSYRYDNGTDTYDTSEKSRTPAYTDRVLWWAPEGSVVEATPLTVYKDVRASDHKPISVLLKFRGAKEIPGRKQEIMEKLKQYKSTKGMPTASLKPSSTEVDFGSVEAGIPSTQTFTVSNDGESALEFQLYSQTEGNLTHRWLTASPFKAVVLPRASVKVTLTLRLRSHTVEPVLLAGAADGPSDG